MITAGPGHALILSALHAAARPAEPWDEAAFATLLNQPGVVALIDERGGLLLMRIVLDEAEILNIAAVDRRQGIGTALLEAGLARAAAQNVKFVHLEVAEDNMAARGLYTRFGFTQSGLRRRYYASGADALVLTLQIPAFFEKKAAKKLS